MNEFDLDTITDSNTRVILIVNIWNKTTFKPMSLLSRFKNVETFHLAATALTDLPENIGFAYTLIPPSAAVRFFILSQLVT